MESTVLRVLKSPRADAMAMAMAPTYLILHC